jgi:hypothetical protein
MHKILFVAVLFLWGTATAQELKPERIVRGNVIASARDPALTITLPKNAIYVGADRWELYGIADCEVHVFVEADADKHVSKVYWLQYEGYLPARPELTHNYTKDRKILFAGRETYVRARFGPTADTGKPDSDLEHVRNLIKTAGYSMPAEMLNLRLVNLLDDKGRKELMIIYSEDLAPTGFSAADLAPGGHGADQWPVIEQALIKRAGENIAFTAGPPP